MEVSALKYSGGIGLHARSPLLRLQSDERLIALVRRGNAPAFETLVSRYETRLLTFCRHMLGSREDAEDVLQEVLAAAYNAMLADERPINVKPWLYRIARNRSLNHLRRARAIGVDTMDVHFAEHGASTADKAHAREEFRLLVGDIHELPETQKSALVLREMDALSYEQIAEAMETTVPSVKSLLVRARVSLAEAAEARLLSCDEVRIELGEIAEGLRKRPSPLVRRHLNACSRCETFRLQLKETNRALAALLPLGPLVLLKQFVWAKTAGSAAGSHAGAAGGAAAGGSAAAGGLIMGGGTGSFVSAGIGAIAAKAAAGLAAASLLAGAAVEVDHVTTPRPTHPVAAVAHPTVLATVTPKLAGASAAQPLTRAVPSHPAGHHHPNPAPSPVTTTSAVSSTSTVSVSRTTTAAGTATAAPAPLPGRTQTQTDPTVLKPTQPQTATLAPSDTSSSTTTDSSSESQTDTQTTSTTSQTDSSSTSDPVVGPGPPNP